MKEPNWDTHLAWLFASMWNPNKANDLPDRIAAIDRALERLPANFRFLDLKAELLSNGNQFERAWQTCQKKTYPIVLEFLDQQRNPFRAPPAMAQRVFDFDLF